MPPDADVLVIGAGPAGSATAALLARQGVRVLLVDKAVAPPPKVCGEYLSPGCLPILDRLGALTALREAGARPLHGMRIHTARGRTLEAPYPGGGQAAAGSPQALSVRRSLLDPVLLDCAVKSGATFQPGFQASDLFWQDDRVAGVHGRQGGQPILYRAPLVVGADGRQSVVARRIGAMRPHPWLDRMALVAYLSGVSRADANGEIFLGRDRYAILNPIAPDLTNVGVVVPRCDLPHGADPRRAFWTLAAGIPGLAPRLTAAQLVVPVRCLGPLAHRATRLAVPGALLVGDAAGFLDPFTGEGIYTALRSAELAAQHVLAQTSARAYAEGWHREFAPKWRLTVLLHRALRRPWLAEALVCVLSRRPGLTGTLMAAFGDLLSPDDLRGLRFLPRLVRSVGGEVTR